MENTVKKILILLSVVTGLMFAAVLCYSLTVGVLPRLETVDSEARTDAGDLPATQEVTDNATPAPVPTKTPAQENYTKTPAPNAAPVDAGADGLTWNGLQIDIANINYNAWPLIKAKNQNNDPPLEGMTMLLVTVRATNVEGAEEERIALDASDFQLIGDRNTVYKTFQVSCGVAPDRLDGVIAAGDTMDGNICFQISTDENNFQLIYEPFGSPAVYFDLPERSDTEWLAPNPPPVLIESKNLTWNGLQIDIANINYDAWPLIKAQNQNNNPPLAGMTMLLVTIRASNVEGAAEEYIKLSASDLKLIGSRKTVYQSFQVSCGVIPDRLNGVVAPGDFMDANVCFQISTDESDFQLIYEPFGSPAIYFDLPPRPSGK